MAMPTRLLLPAVLWLSLATSSLAAIDYCQADFVTSGKTFSDAYTWYRLEPVPYHLCCGLCAEDDACGSWSWRTNANFSSFECYLFDHSVNVVFDVDNALASSYNLRHIKTAGPTTAPQTVVPTFGCHVNADGVQVVGDPLVHGDRNLEDSAMDCCSECTTLNTGSNAAQCRAWNYDASNKSCFLLSSYDSLVPTNNPNLVSGFGAGLGELTLMPTDGLTATATTQPTNPQSVAPTSAPTPVTCFAAPVVSDSVGMDTCAGTKVDQRCDVTCTTGFKPSVDSVACTDMGEWEEASCNARCPDSPFDNISNSIDETPGGCTGKAAGEECQFSCMNGLKSDPDVVQCLPHGQWQKNRACVLDQCILSPLQLHPAPGANITKALAVPGDGAPCCSLCFQHTECNAFYTDADVTTCNLILGSYTVSLDNDNPVLSGWVTGNLPPTLAPTEVQTDMVTLPRTEYPSNSYTDASTSSETATATLAPSAIETTAPTFPETASATLFPSSSETIPSTAHPTLTETATSTTAPTEVPTASATDAATEPFTDAATEIPSSPYTLRATDPLTHTPTARPTNMETTPPTKPYTYSQSASPTAHPSASSTNAPSDHYTVPATNPVSDTATQGLTQSPTTAAATASPTLAFTANSTEAPGGVRVLVTLRFTAGVAGLQLDDESLVGRLEEELSVVLLDMTGVELRENRLGAGQPESDVTVVYDDFPPAKADMLDLDNLLHANQSLQLLNYVQAYKLRVTCRSESVVFLDESCPEIVSEDTIVAATLSPTLVPVDDGGSSAVQWVLITLAIVVILVLIAVMVYKSKKHHKVIQDYKDELKRVKKESRFKNMKTTVRSIGDSIRGTWGRRSTRKGTMTDRARVEMDTFSSPDHRDMDGRSEISDLHSMAASDIPLRHNRRISGLTATSESDTVDNFPGMTSDELKQMGIDPTLKHFSRRNEP